MNPARAPLRERLSSPAGGNLAPLKTLERGHFLFQQVHTARFGFNAKQIFIYLRCWWLVQRIGWRMAWESVVTARWRR